MLYSLRCLSLILVLGLAAPAWAADAVLGRWEGSWQNKGGEPNKLLADIAVGKDADAYDAIFTAHFGAVGKYKVPLKGKRDGDVVRFGGRYDLGDAGGVFEWSGEISGDEFKGKYSSPADVGTFDMKRAPAPKK